MRLDLFRNSSFSRGAPMIAELAWIMCSGLLVSGFLPGSKWRVLLLRLFGSRIGVGVVVKPRVRVKFPWRLCIGDHCWIGEDVWIDNLSQVELGSHVCLSQGVYICTGSHDWNKETFDLIVKPVTIDSHVWVGAFSRVAPGAHIKEGAMLCMCSVASGTLAPWTIFRGSPAVAYKSRVQIT